MNKKSKKECIACGEEIHIQAKVCTHCNSYQSAWKNQLGYFGTLIGVLSLVVGAISFVVSSIPSIRQVVAWHDEVKVLTFSSTKPISIVNIGDGEVYVTHLNIRGTRPSGSPYSDTERVNQFIEPGKLVTVDREIKVDGYSVAIGTKPEEIQNLLNKANLISSKDACVMMVFTIEEDPGFDTFKSFLGEKMITFEVKAFIRYYSIKKQVYVDQEIPMIGYLITSKASSCQEAQ